MSTRKDYDSVFIVLPLLGTIVLLVNLYYYCHPLLSALSLSNWVIDFVVSKLRGSSAFSNPYYTKMIALMLSLPAFSLRRSSATELSWGIIVILFLFGLAMYLMPLNLVGIYLVSSTIGFVALNYSAALASRKSEFGIESDNGCEESFAQCEKLIENDESVNIRTEYRFGGRKHHGWINVINPFRATLVLGTPGAGKSFSVYGPFISQMIAKGYAMFVYDFKFPDLTEQVYNELLNSSYMDKMSFYVLNFQDPFRSYRCNPIHPRYITDPADTTEIAGIVMQNLNRGANDREDFFTLSAKVYLDALIWFLRVYHDGEFCTFPHVIELMSRDYRTVFQVLQKYPELAVKIKPFANALEGGAMDQLQGQIASAQIPMGKFVSKSLYWVLTGDDFSLEINDSEHPKILCVGNDPERQEIYSTTLALYTSRIFKLINHKGRNKCAVLLDELPTIYLNGLDHLIATARSNKVAIVMGVQDKSQLIRDYGNKEAEVIFNTVGNVFCGQVNGETAVQMSRTFGKHLVQRTSVSQSMDSESRTISQQKDEILPVSTIETLSRGVFFGKVADGGLSNQTMDKKFFYSSIRVDEKRNDFLRKNWKEIPIVNVLDENDPKSDIAKDMMRQMIDNNFVQIQKDISSIFSSLGF